MFLYHRRKSKMQNGKKCLMGRILYVRPIVVNVNATSNVGQRVFSTYSIVLKKKKTIFLSVTLSSVKSIRL